MFYQISIGVVIILIAFLLRWISKRLDTQEQMIAYLTFHLPQPQEDEDNLFLKDLKRLQFIKKLPENWDEEGAESFSERFNLRLFCVLSGKLNEDPPTMISPTSQKSVIFEYIDKNSGRLAIEFYEGDKLTQIFWLRDKEEFSKEIEDSEIPMIVEKYREGTLNEK